MIRSDLCDYSDAYILVKGKITVNIVTPGANVRNKRNRPLAFKNNAPFISCISKINGKLIENAEDLDIVMPMYNLFEYSENYRKTTDSLWNYYRDELTDETNDNNSPNKNILGNTYNIPRQIRNNEGNLVDNPNYDVNNEGKKETEIVTPLKYLSNF